MKIIKKIKIFPTGSYFVRLNKGIDTREELEQYNKELKQAKNDAK